jgi:hypothetical protein
MRLILTWLFAFSLAGLSYSQDKRKLPSDTLKRNDLTLRINYRSPDYSGYGDSYKILSNVNEKYEPVEIFFSLQNHLNESGYTDSSLNADLDFAGRSFISPYYQPEEKELFYGVWRNQIIRSSSEADIRHSVTDGTNTMIALGYDDLARDFMPFITSLMEEQQLYNYDPGRTKGFGKAATGIVTSVQLLNAIGSADTRIYAGVCRDVHETGRELLKTMSEVYFGHFYPEKKINFDDYLFLQSWTTNKSQHVTLSMINPLDTKTVYELDWGRVIEKKNIRGYDNGRMFGNNFRIWQFDKEKNRSVPVDFRRTSFGKILDEDLLSSEEYARFNGIYDEESYSSIGLKQSAGKFGHLNSSIGMYNPDQRFFLTSYSFTPAKKKIGGFLYHSGIYAIQAAIQEDTRKRELLYPQWNWQLSSGIMFVPRYISKFETRSFRINKSLAFDLYFEEQFDGFFTIDAFVTREVQGIDKNDFSCSGDANLSFSNGINLTYNPPARSLRSVLSLQGRSTLLPNDIRLLSPNPVVIFSHLAFITTGLDVISNTSFQINPKNSLSLYGMLEFTNMNAALYQVSVAEKIKLSEKISLTASAGSNGQMKGMNYYWYPASKSWISLQLFYLRNSLSFSLKSVSENKATVNISYFKYLN